MHTHTLAKQRHERSTSHAHIYFRTPSALLMLHVSCMALGKTIALAKHANKCFLSPCACLENRWQTHRRTKQFYVPGRRKNQQFPALGGFGFGWDHTRIHSSRALRMVKSQMSFSPWIGSVQAENYAIPRNRYYFFWYRFGIPGFLGP